LCGHMVVEIQHEKLGATLHTDTFSYVKHAHGHVLVSQYIYVEARFFYSYDVSQSLALVKPMFSDMVSYVNSCTLRRRICKLKSCG